MNPSHLAACLLLCKRFNIAIVTTPAHLFPTSHGAPAGYLCDVDANSIRVPADYDWQSHVDGYAPRYGFQCFLHEAIHLIVQPPFASIDEMPERWLLMQVELAYAKALVDKEGIDLVTAWQRYTLTGSERPYVVGKDDFIHWQQPYWREGYRLARKVGLLDVDNQPTWARPNWRRLSKVERESWRGIVASDAVSECEAD
jgi:hypothetical protein